MDSTPVVIFFLSQNELDSRPCRQMQRILTWTEVCEYPRLNDLPYRIDTDRRGHKGSVENRPLNRD